MNNIHYPYLKDSAFLNVLDSFPVKEQFIKIIILDWEEIPIAEIQGYITGGSLTLDGNSAIRRQGNVTFVTENDYYKVLDINNLISINKKIRIEVGFKNILKNSYPQYKDFDIFWIPQGVYVIITPTITNNNSGLQISLTVKDKMCLLNGECGGIFPAQISLHEKEDENGIITRVTYREIIRELVNEFGGEQLGKIIINDIDDRIKKVMKWVGDSPLKELKKSISIPFILENNFFQANLENISTIYINNNTPNTVEFFVQEKDQEEISYEINGNSFMELRVTSSISLIRVKAINLENPISAFYNEDMIFNPYENIGYIYAPFCPQEDLIANAGQNIVNILDTIKNQLGNYEYFYDIEGNFIFQEIKNYLNTSHSTDEYKALQSYGDKSYYFEPDKNKSKYSFEGGNFVISYQNAPQYNNIKNDYLVWGNRKTSEGVSLPIRYHLALDYKPKTNNYYHCITLQDGDIETIQEILYAGLNYEIPEEKIKSLKQNESYKIIKTKDFRTELYIEGVRAEKEGLGIYKNRYYPELKSEWGKIFRLIKNDTENYWEDIFITEVQIKNEDGTITTTDPLIDYYLDLIEPEGQMKTLMVNSIGVRSKVWTEKNVNCIFEKAPPDIILIEAGTEETDKLRKEAVEKGQSFYQVPSIYYKAISSGGYQNSAFNAIRDILYQYTNYNESITLTALPIYYLEPNTRITIEDEKSNIHGDYMIKSITRPFDCNGTMSITATKALERF